MLIVIGSTYEDREGHEGPTVMTAETIERIRDRVLGDVGRPVSRANADAAYITPGLQSPAAIAALIDHTNGSLFH